MTRSWVYLSVGYLAVLLAGVPAAVAKDAAAWLQEGNVALRSGKIDDALSAYDQVAMTEPESPYLQFNQALAHYAQGDYQKAVGLFDKAWLNARQLPRPDIALEARSQLGIGNCHFRDCQRQADADLKQAMAACTKSIQAYDQALVHEPELAAAENNRRVARYVFKRLLNEAAQRAKQAAEQQKQQQELAKELSELADKQQQTAQQSDAAAKQSPPQRQQQRDDIAEKQQQISSDTDQLADKMQQVRGQNQPNQDAPAPKDPVQDSIDQARQKQADAEKKLDRQDLAGAAKDQQDAAEKLREAQEKLREEQEKLREEQEKQAQEGEKQAGENGKEGEKGKEQAGKESEKGQAGDEGDDKQAGAEGEEGQQGQDKQQGEQQNALEQGGDGQEQQDGKEDEQTLRLSEDARDIIDNERRQRQQRDSARQGDAVRPVARDW